MYLEGSDQHRGWFHSSLLEAVGTRGQAALPRGPDARLRRRRRGPEDVEVASATSSRPTTSCRSTAPRSCGCGSPREDYTQDIRLSDEILDRLAEAYRRIRNTCRFLLGNLADFDPATDAVVRPALDELDRWALLPAPAS